MIRVSAVSYLNTEPFIYGLKRNRFSDNIRLSLDYPSLCAEKLLNNEVDIGLVPISILKNQDNLKIISDYCIGADGNVESVCLFSNSPINKVETIYLDYQSKTSIELLKILLKEYWRVQPKLLPLSIDAKSNLRSRQAQLIIGDRAFKFKETYSYSYDLSYYWKEMTGLPFVFACWLSNKDLDPAFIRSFNLSLFYGLNNITNILKNLGRTYQDCYDIKDYLTNKISYKLDSKKREAMELFLNKIST